LRSAELVATPPAVATRVRSIVLRTGLGLLAGGLLVLVFLSLVNLGVVAHLLRHLNVGISIACGVAFLSAYVVRALRWRYLLRPCRVSVRRAVAIYQVATFLNWLLPVQGGEIAKCVLLRRSDGIPVGVSLPTVAMDKTMDLLPSVVLLAVLPFAGIHLSHVLLAVLLGALALAACVFAAIALSAWRRDRAVAIVVRPMTALLPGRLGEHVEPFVVQFIDTLGALIRRPRVLALAAGLTGIAVLLDASFCLLAFKAVGVSVALPTILFGYTLFNLVFILPTPPGHIGTNELMGLLIFSGVFGVNRSEVGAMFLFSHPWTGLLMTCSGLACLSAMGLTLRSSLRLGQDKQELEKV